MHRLTSGRRAGRATRGRALLLPALLLAALPLAGCAAHPAPPAPVSPIRPVPVSPVARMHEQPPIYARIYYRGDDKWLIEKANTKLVTACMAAHGLTYRPPERADSPEDQAMLRPFGVESASERAPAVPANPEPRHADDDAYRFALFGLPDRRVTAKGDKITVTAAAEGCDADAERRLLGDRRVREMELRVLLFEAESRALDDFETDKNFDPVRRAWRDCMRAAGFTRVTDPATLLDELPAKANLATDKSVAADLSCKVRTDYLRHAYETMAVLQRRELAGRPGLLDEWDDIQRAELSAAAAINSP